MNIKTITTVDGVNVVDFGSAASRFYWIENLGSTTVYVSGNENIVPDGDNVKVLSAGCGTMIENLGGKVYILGAGKFQITNQGDKFCPFKIAPVADGGVMASGNPVVMDNLQGDVPFSEITVSGDDIIGQELTVNVSGKNLISYPYYETTKTINGITFSDNGDGTITVNGTATAKSNFWLYPINKDFMGLCDGIKYTLSGNSCVTGDIQLSLGQYSGTKWVSAVNDIGNGKTFNISHNSNYDNLSLSIYVAAGAVLENIIIHPQIELGNTATDYEPYHGSTTTITPDSNPYIVPNDIRQQEGLNVVSVSEGEISVTGVRKNAAVKKIWDKIDELTTAIIVSNGETIE